MSFSKQPAFADTVKSLFRSILRNDIGFINIKAMADEFLRDSCVWGSGHKIQVNLLKMLLENGANPSLPNKYGETCIHLSLYYPQCLRRNAEALKLLIKAGADIHRIDNMGFSPSMLVIQQGLHGWYKPDNGEDVWKEWARVLRSCGFYDWDIDDLRDEAVASLLAMGIEVSPWKKLVQVVMYDNDDDEDDGDNADDGDDEALETGQAPEFQETHNGPR